MNLIVAAIGAVLVLWIWRSVRGGHIIVGLRSSFDRDGA